MDDIKKKFNLQDSNFSDQEIAEMMSPALREERERKEKHEKFIKDVLTGDSEDNSGPYEMRCIVEYKDWYVPLGDDGQYEILNVRKGEYERLVAGLNKDGRRNVRGGQGGQCLPVYKSKPQGNCAHLDGPELIRSLPAKITGLLMERKEGEPLEELSSEFFEPLKRLVKSAEVEKALLEPGPIDTAKLREAKFIVAMNSNNLPYVNYDMAHIATNEDMYLVDSDSRKEMTGEEIFKHVLEKDYFAGIVFNSPCMFGPEGDEIKEMGISLNFIDRALKSDRCELRAPQLVARNRKEFEYWLDMSLFPKERETLEEKDTDGTTYICAVSKEPCNYWRQQETTYGTIEPKIVSTPKFKLLNEPMLEGELAKGPSPILCPGLIAKSLYCQLPMKDRKENLWRPGKSLLFARWLSADDIANSKERIMLANELLKLIPAGADSIPKTSLLSVAGGQFLCWIQAARKREWAQTVLEQAKRNCKMFVS